MHAFDDPLPSPASTVASLTRELEDTLQTLDLQAAMRGQYVVKPQVIYVINFLYCMLSIICFIVVY